MRISDWSSDVCSSDLTGLAESDDLLNWRKRGIALGRDLSSPITRYNVAMSSILREPDLHAKGRSIKVDGRYLASWNAYPQPGMEEGPAVIGLAWRSEEHTSELQSLMRNSYAVFCLKKK